MSFIFSRWSARGGETERGNSPFATRKGNRKVVIENRSDKSSLSFIEPDYHYLESGYSERIHKFRYRKNRFKIDENLLFVEGLTELELAKLNNLDRIWDCGKIKFEKVNPKRQKNV